MIVTLYRTGKDGRLLYYTLHDRQQSLTSPYALTTAWRSGNGREREKLHLFESLAEMDKMIRSILAKRVKDGYRLLYSFSRDARWTVDGADASVAGHAAAAAAGAGAESSRSAQGRAAQGVGRGDRAEAFEARGGSSGSGLLARAEASLHPVRRQA
jgi:hypothetical protein